MSEESADKPFEATEQRLAKAREDGDIPRSTEVNSALMYVGFSISLVLLAPVFFDRWGRMVHRLYEAETWVQNGGFAVARSQFAFAGLALIILVAVPAIVILIGIVTQRGFVVSTKKLKFDAKKINPMQNAKQKYGSSGLVTFAISAGKAIMVGAAGYVLFSAMLEKLALTGANYSASWISGLQILMVRALFVAVAISIIFAVADYLWKVHDHRRRLRMSRKELEDEAKNAEGDPQMKARRREKAIDIAMSNMLEDVARADVIIVNPTHFAVALEWKRGSGRAPICVAKGVDEIALRIRERGKTNDIPVWSDPPCARALFSTVTIGHEVQPEHFGPVAAAIRFAEDMRRKARSGW